MTDSDMTNDIPVAIQADFEEEYGSLEAAEALRECPWVIGETYLFRLATYAWVGTVRSVGMTEIVLEPAACVFDTGRFGNAISEGLDSQEQSEYEPAERAIIGRGAHVDSVPYKHPVPLEAK